MGTPQAPQVIVLNGGSSSGKSGISRCLQTVLRGPWLRLGVDDLVDRLPPLLLASGDGLAFGSHGQIAVGTGFSEIEAAWLDGVAAMAKAGARIVYDDVFLGGATSQRYPRVVSRPRPRRRRPRMAALLGSLTALAVALALLVTGWFLLAVPFTVVGAYGAWLGLSNEELFDSFDAASGDDAGRGPTGLSW